MPIAGSCAPGIIRGRSSFAEVSTYNHQKYKNRSRRLSIARIRKTKKCCCQESNCQTMRCRCGVNPQAFHPVVLAQWQYVRKKIPGVNSNHQPRTRSQGGHSQLGFAIYSSLLQPIKLPRLSPRFKGTRNNKVLKSAPLRGRAAKVRSRVSEDTRVARNL